MLAPARAREARLDQRNSPGRQDASGASGLARRTISASVSSARLRKQALFRGPRLVEREARLPPTQWSRAHDQDFIVLGNWFLCALHDRRRERENVRLAAPLVSCGPLEAHTECHAGAIAPCL